MRHAISAMFLGMILATTLMGESSSGPPRFQAWGFDAALLSYGGGFGGIWQMDLNQNFAAGAEAALTFVQTGQSLEGYNYYGQYIQYGTQNLSFLKVIGGMSWYPFAARMDPTFQFGLFGGLGPILAMNTADTTKDWSRWRHAEYTPAIYSKLGLEFKIRQPRAGIYLFRIGYDFTDFRTEIDRQSIYQGVFLQVGMEFPRYK